MDDVGSSENAPLWRTRVETAPLLTFVLSDGEAGAAPAAAAAAGAQTVVSVWSGWLPCARASRRRRQPGRHARRLRWRLHCPLHSCSLHDSASAQGLLSSVDVSISVLGDTSG